MRLAHEEMIELVDVFEKEGEFFAQIAKFFSSERFVYQFGVSKAGYNTVRRIQQFRPFDNISSSKYKYFWAYACGTNDGFYLDIQYQQGKAIKSFPIKSDQQFGCNLRWFMEINDPDEIKHLKVKT